MAFVKAECKNVFIKLGIYGISGSGKTWTSLAIAKGIAEQCGSRIAVIDTENHSAERYADRFDFDVDNLDEKSAKGYMAAMQEAVAAGYKVLVIDSLSHEWEAVLEYVDKQESNNNMRAWAKATPLQRKFIDFIMGLPCHVIATMRSKTEWVIGQNDKGRTTVERRGLAPVQGKDIEYNFDILLEINRKHSARFLKSRIGNYQDQIIEHPGEDLGKEIYEWTHKEQEVPREAMQEGTPPRPPAIPQLPIEQQEPPTAQRSPVAGQQPPATPQPVEQPSSPVAQQAAAARAAQVADIMALTYSDWNGLALMTDAERDGVKADCERLGANLDEIKRQVETHVNFREKQLQVQHGMYRGDRLNFEDNTPRGAVRLGGKQRCFP
jgi:hypothetical protein